MVQPTNKRLVTEASVGGHVLTNLTVDGPTKTALGEAIGTQITTPGTPTATALSATILDQVSKANTGLPDDGWAHWGDSLTTVASGGDWTGKFALRHGRASFNGGWGGQVSQQIAARQGGVPALLTVTGNQIPASGSVAVTAIVHTPVSSTVGGTWQGTLAGVPGALFVDGSGNHTFTRTTAGTVVAAPAGTRFISTDGASNRARKFTIEVGRNDFKTTPPAEMVASIRAMINYVPGAKQGFVFDISPWDTEPMPAAPGSSRDKLNILNAAIAAAFPEYYLPVFQMLRTADAAAAAGITFTAQDQTDITNGVTPTSFRFDGGHLNAAGGTALAYFLTQAAYSRGYVHAPANLPGETVTNLVIYPNPTATGAGWSGHSNIPFTSSEGTWSAEPVTWAPVGHAVRITGVATSTVNGIDISQGGSPSNRALVTPGQTYTHTLWVKSNKAVDVALRVRYYLDQNNTQVQQVFAPTVTLVPNVPQRLVFKGVAPAGTDRTQLTVKGMGTSNLADGSYVEATAAMATLGPDTFPYRDGASTGWAWNGAAGASTSTGIAVAQ